MADLAGVHEELQSIDPRPLSRPELYGLIKELEKLRCRVDERLLAAKAALDSLGDTGADSTIVGRSVGRRSQRQAKKDQTTARGLAEMPTLASGLAEGRLNTEHAAIVAAAAEMVTPEVAAELVPLAEAIPADLFAKKAREFIGRHTTADEAERRHRRQRERRAAWHTVNGDGSVEMHARFDRVTGEQVLAAWKRSTDDLWRADGGRDGAPADVRTPSQRRADSLASLITTTRGDDPAAVHPRFQIHIVWNLSERSVTWLDGAPVPDSVIEAIRPTADVIGHIFDGDGHPLWQGRARRLATIAQWRSLIVATRGCKQCGNDIDLCQAHHLQEWLNGGPSDIDNLELNCHTCHGIAHRGSRGDPAKRRRSKPGPADPMADEHCLQA